MYEVAEGDAGVVDNLLFREVGQCLHDSRQIVAGIFQAVSDGVELAEDTCLHLLGSLVGESDGKDGTIGHWILDDKGHVFPCQRESLS